MSDNIRVERRGACQVIRIDRPEKKNALTRAMYAAMTRALTQGDDDSGIRVHVLLGVPGAFSSGNDISDFMAVAQGATFGHELLDFLVALAASRKPIVSGCDGIAVGIGTTMHLHCDLTFATARTVFRTPFVDLGLVPEAGSSLLAPALLGHQRAFALLALGEGLPADQARAAGLIHAVVDETELEARVLSAAEALAARPPEALRIARELIRGPREPVIERIRLEARHFAERLKSHEARAAFSAFLERRKPS